jgi:hypothetical protein
MANGRAERVEEALLSLVDAHLTASPGEDEDILEDRRDEAAERAREILERSVYACVVVVAKSDVSS